MPRPWHVTNCPLKRSFPLVSCQAPVGTSIKSAQGLGMRLRFPVTPLGNGKSVLNSKVTVCTQQRSENRPGCLSDNTSPIADGVAESMARTPSWVAPELAFVPLSSLTDHIQQNAKQRTRQEAEMTLCGSISPAAPAGPKSLVWLTRLPKASLMPSPSILRSVYSSIEGLGIRLLASSLMPSPRLLT